MAYEMVSVSFGARDSARRRVTRARGIAGLVSATLVLLLSVATGAAPRRYLEDFTTKDYCDTLSTTARWDTLAGELRLPDQELSVIGSPAAPAYTIGVALDGD